MLRVLFYLVEQFLKKPKRINAELNRPIDWILTRHKTTNGLKGIKKFH